MTPDLTAGYGERSRPGSGLPLARYTGAMADGAPDDDPPPVPPVRPRNDECCGGGCNPCIFDAYDEALQRYEAALAAWRVRHARDAPRD